jgi:hypothetical protein
MANAQKLLEAKKAKIQAKAQKEIAEIDELVRLAEKHGLDVVERVTGTAAAAMPVTSPSMSIFTRAKTEGEAIIRAAGKPVPLDNLHIELVKRGIVIKGKRPKNTLSAYLGQNPALVSTSAGWWLKDVVMPKVEPVSAPRGTENTVSKPIAPGLVIVVEPKTHANLVPKPIKALSVKHVMGSPSGKAVAES